MHNDEPDNPQSPGRGKGYGPPVPPAKVVADYERMKRADPSRPVFLNLGQGWPGTKCLFPAGSPAYRVFRRPVPRPPRRKTVLPFRPSRKIGIRNPHHDHDPRRRGHRGAVGPGGTGRRPGPPGAPRPPPGATRPDGGGAARPTSGRAGRPLRRGTGGPDRGQPETRRVPPRATAAVLPLAPPARLGAAGQGPPTAPGGPAAERGPRGAP